MRKCNAIYIVGAGAIGKALAVFLKLNHKNVVILRGSVDDKSNFAENITVELNENTELTTTINVSTVSNFSTLNGIIVFTNKSFGNPQLADAFKNKIQDSPIVILQNGLNIELPFIKNDFTQIYRGVLFATSQYLTANKLKFKPVAVSPVGFIKGNAENLAVLVAELSTSYFEFRQEQHIQPVIWTKAIINCVFNSVCPLLEVDNGIFYRYEKALNIARRIIAECISVAASQGITLDMKKVVDSLLLISKSSEGQLISTYQDIKNKRRTEIDTLNFAIAEIAGKYNSNNLITATKLLGELIDMKSELSRCN